MTGRRAIVTKLGATPLETFERHLEIVPQESSEPGDDEVVIAVRSAAVGWVDLVMASGQYQHVPEPPYTPGLEYSGDVLRVGSAVSGVRAGDRVLVDGMATGPRSLGAHRREGGFGSYAVAPASAVIPLPDGLSYDEGACLLGGFETAWHALVHRAQVRAGETVLVLGASGSTGLAAVQVAKRLGATVLAAGRSREKLAAAREADHFVGVEALRDEVKAVVPRGVDVVYDPVGGAISVEALRACAFGARFVVVGWSSTPFVGRGGRDPNVLPTNLVLMKSIDVLGSPAAIAAHRDPTLRETRLNEILAWARDGLRPHVGATYAFDDLREALKAKWEGRHAGNVVLHPK